MKKYLPVIALLVVAFSVRGAYAIYQPNALIMADSVGYYTLGTDMVHHFKLSSIINQYRTPGYPLFLMLIMWLTGNKLAPLYSEQFMEGAFRVTTVQMFLGVGSAFLTYAILRTFRVKRTWAMIAGLFVACDMSLLALERSMLTEPLSLFFLMITLYALARLFHKQTLLWGTVFVIGSTCSWLIRPALIILPFAGLLALWIKSPHPVNTIRISLIVLFASAMPFVYTSLNYILHGYPGISQVSDINMLGRILEFQIPIEAGAHVPIYYNAVLQYRSQHLYPMPFRLLEMIDPGIYGDVQKIVQLREFNRAVIAANIPSYVLGAIGYLPNVFTSYTQYLSVQQQQGNILSYIFSSLQQIYRIVWFTCMSVFVLIPLWIWKYIHKRTPATGLTLALSGLLFAEILVVLLVVPEAAFNEYERLFAIFHPIWFMIIVLASQEVNKNRSKKAHVQ